MRTRLIPFAAVAAVLLVVGAAKSGSANESPVLAAVPTQRVACGCNLTFTASASDDGPSAQLQYWLSDAPPGASIMPATGVFNWTPTTDGTFTFTVHVHDGGMPILFDQQPVTVTVYIFQYHETFAGEVQSICELADRAPNANVTIRDLDTGNVLWSDTAQNSCAWASENGALLAAGSGKCTEITNGFSEQGRCLDNGTCTGECRTEEIDKSDPASHGGIVSYKCPCYATTPVFDWPSSALFLSGLFALLGTRRRRTAQTAMGGHRD
jgi:hypothetical protein